MQVLTTAPRLPHRYVPAGYCCTQSSIATQCAAYTQYRLGYQPTASAPAFAFSCLMLFLVLECIARRAWGYRCAESSIPGSAREIASEMATEIAPDRCAESAIPATSA